MEGECSKNILSDKKIQECLYLKQVLELLRITPCEIICGESPDFKVLLKNKRIGVEVTEYYLDIGSTGSIARKREEYDKCIEARLNSKVAKYNYLKGIATRFMYKSDSRPSKQELDNFIDELISATTQVVKNDNWKGFKEPKSTNDFPLLKKYINAIRIYKTQFYSYWQRFHFSTTALQETNSINVIDPKISKAKKYKKINESEDLWLIIGVGRLDSQSVPPVNFVEKYLKSFNKIEEILKNSLFDKVYFYLSFEHTAFEWPGWTKIAL